jgi:rare lipoprotein A (peptidoglycan hydrolase)
VSDRRIGQPRPDVRRPRKRSQTQLTGPRPDLVAAWAVALGIFLILVASATSQGATGGVAPPPPEPRSSPRSGVQDDLTRDTLSSLGGELGLGSVDMASASSLRAIVKRMKVQRATWYGPGFYGNRTACGVRLRPTTLGVAHKRLPCGTRVTFFHRGAFRTVPVIDRGPFVGSISWDLTAATARKLGFRRSGPVRVIH